VFATTQDARGAQRLVEESRIVDDLLDVVSVTPATQRVVGIVIKGNIQDGTQIEVESEDPEQFARDSAVPGNEFGITPVPKRIGVGRFVSNQTQPGNTSPLLINRDDGFDPAQIAQVIDQFPKLVWGLDVSTEENVSARLDPTKDGGGLFIQFGAGNAR
jgi:hypothetical protein